MGRLGQGVGWTRGAPLGYVARQGCVAGEGMWRAGRVAGGDIIQGRSGHTQAPRPLAAELFEMSTSKSFVRGYRVAVTRYMRNARGATSI